MLADNPIIWADYPDPDVIYHDGAYYMISTAMHYFPGAQILRSYDLTHWEHCSYVYDKFGETPGQRLDNGNIYGKGMWAPCLRYHNGLFHVVFSCNDTHKMYHYTASSPDGKWTRHDMDGFYYDSSVLFDDDGRVYIAHGNRVIHITELLPDLSAPKPGGLDRVAITDSPNIMLGWEGSHFYKIDGKYYIFCIHWAKGGLRSEGCFTAASPNGFFIGGELVYDDMGYGQGVAQGGIIETPKQDPGDPHGERYLMLFQDHGAVGRIPVLVPMRWETGYPAVGHIPERLDLPSLRPKHEYSPLYASDTLRGRLSPLWQYNHEPHKELISVTAEGLKLTTDRTAPDIEQAVNTLTQRCFGPRCACEVTVSGAGMNGDDSAGICALMGCFGQLALTRGADGYALSLTAREPLENRERDEIREYARVPIAGDTARLRAEFDFTDDTVRFGYYDGGKLIIFDHVHKLVYRLDHFVGCRAGLFCYSTKQAGGSALFADFVYEK